MVEEDLAEAMTQAARRRDIPLAAWLREAARVKLAVEQDMTEAMTQAARGQE